MIASFAAQCGARSRALVARWAVKRSVTLSIEGWDHVPPDGPVLLAARHYHHLLDAAILLATFDRPVHIVIALDWLAPGFPLSAMRWLARAARWPAVWRGNGPRSRTGLRDLTTLLVEGHLALIFPEAYPTIDPEGSRQLEPDGFLPFLPGFAACAIKAADQSNRPIPVVPVGFHYIRTGHDAWTVRTVFGPPCWVTARTSRQALVASIEADVRQLSSAPLR